MVKQSNAPNGKQSSLFPPNETQRQKHFLCRLHVKTEKRNEDSFVLFAPAGQISTFLIPISRKILYNSSVRDLQIMTNAQQLRKGAHPREKTALCFSIRACFEAG